MTFTAWSRAKNPGCKERQTDGSEVSFDIVSLIKNFLNCDVLCSTLCWNQDHERGRGRARSRFFIFFCIFIFFWIFTFSSNICIYIKYNRTSYSLKVIYFSFLIFIFDTICFFPVRINLSLLILHYQNRQFQILRSFLR